MSGSPRGCVAVLAFALASSFATTLPAQDSPFEASVRCESVTAPARIVCQLNARSPQGKLVWSDALVVRAPEFARPLRSRWLAQLDPAGASGGAAAKLALVASKPGQGELELLARGVICHESSTAEWCEPVRARVVVELRAAAAVSSPP